MRKKRRKEKRRQPSKTFSFFFLLLSSFVFITHHYLHKQKSAYSFLWSESIKKLHFLPRFFLWSSALVFRSLPDLPRKSLCTFYKSICINVTDCTLRYTQSRLSQPQYGKAQVTLERRTGWTAKICLSWWVSLSEGISSTDQPPYLVEPDRELANGCSHGQLSPGRCRVEHRRMDAPMVALRHGLGVSFRCPWLTLDPTSLGEDVNAPTGLISRRCRVKRRWIGAPHGRPPTWAKSQLQVPWLRRLYPKLWALPSQTVLWKLYGMYSSLVHKKERNILRIQIQSRHTSSKVYNLLIETNAGPNPISGWYCKCKNGARVVECCAHIASVLWYPGCSRYHQESPRPACEFPTDLNDASCWSEEE